MRSTEKNALEIIGAAGECRKEAFKALRLAREGKIKEARELLKVAKDMSIKGHEVQSEIISKEANGEENIITLLMIHAQDHLMTSLMAYDLIEELIEMCAEREA